MNDAHVYAAPRRLYAALTRYVSTCEIAAVTSVVVTH